MNDKLEGKPIKKNYKAVLLGNSRVNTKTSLLTFLQGGTFDPNSMKTCCPSCSTEIFLSKNNEEIKFDFFDIPDVGSSNSIYLGFMAGADAIILGFDIGNYGSFEGVKNFW